MEIARFPRVWWPACNKIQPMNFEVMKAINRGDHDAANIACGECKRAEPH
jgi:hypothetical protein